MSDPTNDGIECWHFLPADMRLTNGDGRTVAIGETVTVDPTRVAVRSRGLHGSTSATEALRYASGPVACRVRLSGVVARDGTLYAASERTTLAAAHAEATLHEFACRCAESVVHLAGHAEAACRAAIDAKRAWLRGEIDPQQLAAARDAAGDAAGDAAWPADRNDARAAAGDAAGAAAWVKQESMLTAMLTELLGLGSKPEA